MRCLLQASTAVLAGLTCMAVLAGCGYRTLGARPVSATASTAANLAVATNSGCVHATPVIERALGVLSRLHDGKVPAVLARRILGSEMAGLEHMARETQSDTLRVTLANAFDAFTAFRAVMLNRNEPAYPSTYANLAGTLNGFQRTCSVVTPDVVTGPSARAAAYGPAALGRSATTHDAPWSVQVMNAWTGQGPAGFTISPPSVATTLKGTEQVALWARAKAGTPLLMLQVRELSGSTVVGSERVTTRLGPAFRFEYLSYRIRRPGRSRLSLTVWAPNLAPGEAFVTDDITIVRG
jgi:hypothetical protein